MHHAVTVGAQQRQIIRRGFFPRTQFGQRFDVMAFNITVAVSRVAIGEIKIARLAKQPPFVFVLEFFFFQPDDSFVSFSESVYAGEYPTFNYTVIVFYICFPNRLDFFRGNAFFDGFGDLRDCRMRFFTPGIPHITRPLWFFIRAFRVPVKMLKFQHPAQYTVRRAKVFRGLAGKRLVDAPHGFA